MKSEDFQLLPVHTGRRIIKNAIWNFIGRMGPTLSAFFLIPYVVTRIGKEYYGIWALSFILTNYAGLLDLGFGTGLTKFVAEHFAVKDERSFLEEVNTGYFFYMIFGFLISVLMWILTPHVVHLLKMDSRFESEAVFALRGSFIAFLFINFLMLSNSILNGIQRMDLTNKISLLNTFFNLIGTLIVLKSGLGLRGLILNSIIVAACSSLIALFVNFGTISYFKLSPRFLSVNALKKLGLYGVKMQVSSVAGMIVTEFDKILTAYFLSVAYLTFYQIGSRACDFIKSFPMTAIGAILPTASEIDALEQRDILRDLYERGSKYFLAISAPIIISVVFFGRTMIHFWMGDGFGPSATVLQLLSIAYLFNVVTTGCGTAIVRGIGKPGHLIPYALTGMSASIILGIYFGKKFGLIGILAATGCSNFLSSSLFYVRFHRMMAWDSLRLLRIWGKGIACMIIVLVPVSLVAPSIDRIAYNSNRIVSFLIIFLSSLIIILLYELTAILVKYFDKQDLRIMKMERFAHPIAFLFDRKN